MIEAIDVLKGGGAESKDLIDLSVKLTARMIKLAGLTRKDDEAEARARKALSSGAGLEVFRKCIEQQGGDPRVIDDPTLLPLAPLQTQVKAGRSGFIEQMDAERVGLAAMVLGAGRNRTEDKIDHSVGIVVRSKPGETIKSGDSVFEVRYQDEVKLASALELLDSSYTISQEAPTKQTLILEEIA